MNRCRTCMGTTSLNPIFQFIDKSDEYTDILAMTTGLKIIINDALPQVMCTECVNFVNKHQDFREMCLNSYRSLIKCINNEATSETTIIIKVESDSQSIDMFEEKNAFDSTNDDSKNDNPDSKNDNDFNNDKLIIVNDKIDCKNDSKDIDKAINKNEEFETSINVLINNKHIDKDKNNIDKEKQNNIIESKVLDIVSRKKADNKKKWRKKKVDKVKSKDSKRVKKKIKTKEEEIVSKESTEDDKELSNIEFKCKYCLKVFKHKTALRVHLVIHTGRNIVCEHCGKKFLTKRRLLMHCKARHGYEKTDKCSYCDYKGCNPESVKIHERLHTGEKPYVCQECGASFHRSSSYHQHVPIHLPDKTVKCDLCPSLFKSMTLMRIHKNRHKTKRKSRAKIKNIPT